MITDADALRIALAENERLRAFVRACLGFLCDIESEAVRARALSDAALDLMGSRDTVRPPSMYDRETAPDMAQTEDVNVDELIQ